MRARDRAGNSEAPPTTPDATFPTASGTEGDTEDPDGCGCRVTGQGASAAPWAICLALLALRRRRLGVTGGGSGRW